MLAVRQDAQTRPRGVKIADQLRFVRVIQGLTESLGFDQRGRFRIVKQRIIDLPDHRIRKLPHLVFDIDLCRVAGLPAQYVDQESVDEHRLRGQFGRAVMLQGLDALGIGVERCAVIQSWRRVSFDSSSGADAVAVG